MRQANPKTNKNPKKHPCITYPFESTKTNLKGNEVDIPQNLQQIKIPANSLECIERKITN
jgi:hypothetical protein